MNPKQELPPSVSVPRKKEEQKKGPGWNLRTNPEGTIRAMEEVEGPEWRKRQEAMRSDSVSPGEYDWSLSHAREKCARGRTAIIGGENFSVNRWYLRSDGTISFSRRHALSPEFLQKARDQGFDIAEDEE